MIRRINGFGYAGPDPDSNNGALTKYSEPNVSHHFLQYSMIAARSGQGLCYGFNPFNTAFNAWCGTDVIGTMPGNKWFVGFDLFISSQQAAGNFVFLRFEAPSTNNDATATNTQTQLLLRIEGSNAAGWKLAFFNWVGSGGMDGTNANPGIRILGTSSPTLQTDKWYYIELVLQFGLNGNLELWVDDAQSFAMPNLNLGNSLVPNPPDRYSFYWSNFGTGGYAFTSFYLADAANDSLGNAQQRLGPCRVVTVLPNADQQTFWNTNGGGNGYGRVNEHPHDGDSTYIYASSNQHEWLSVGPAPCFGRILGVTLNAIGRRQQVGNASPTALQVRATPFAADTTLLGATDWTNSYSRDASGAVCALFSPVSDYSLRNVGAYWTDGDIEAAWWGLLAAGPGVARVTQVWVEKLVSLRTVQYSCGQLGTYVFGR